MTDRYVRECARDAALSKVMALGCAAVYGALVAYAKRRRLRRAWAARVFEEIYNSRPHQQHRRGPFEVNSTIEDWLAYHRKRHHRFSDKNSAIGAL